MIKLKTLLEQTGYNDDPNYAMYWITKHAPRIAVKLGEQIDKELGGGANGVAFLLKSGKVLKITGDDQEVAAASRYRTKQNVPHIVSVYDVRKLEGDIVAETDPNYEQFKNSWNRGKQHYVIIMDAVTPFTPEEKKVWSVVYRDYLDPRFNNEVTHDELEYSSGQFINAHTIDANWPEILIAQRQSILAAFKRNNVYTSEAHPDNMGWNSKGQLVHFDWWMRTTDNLFNSFETKPRRLNKPIKYDSTGIDTPNDPTM